VTARPAFPELSLETCPEVAPGSIRRGSEEHKNLFCRMLLSTFDPYTPALLHWPELDAAAHARVVSLPIWDMAVQVEGKAGLNVATFAEEAKDPLVKRAIELNAFEERRHKDVLHNLVAAYGIRLEPEPEYVRPRDPEWAFLATGYSECIDSFFAFGLFAAAKRSGFFPPALVDTFEPVMREESRHILFFVNWVDWHRRNMPLWRRPWFAAKVLAVWVSLVRERIGLAQDANGSASEDESFTLTATGELGVDLSVRDVMDLCLAENERRLALYDVRLARPRLVPRLVRFARAVMRRRRRARA
jgi:hypothetical protein